MFSKEMTSLIVSAPLFKRTMLSVNLISKGWYRPNYQCQNHSLGLGRKQKFLTQVETTRDQVKWIPSGDLFPRRSGSVTRPFGRISKGSGNAKNNFTANHNPMRITSKVRKLRLKEFKKLSQGQQLVTANKNARYSGSKVPALSAAILKSDNIRWGSCHVINFAKSSLMTTTLTTTTERTYTTRYTRHCRQCPL